MGTQRVELGPQHVAAAKALAESGDAGRAVWADVAEKGLRLVVRGRSAAWFLSFNSTTKGLGSLDQVRTVKAAREMASAVRALLRSGDDTAAYIAGRHTGRTHQEAINAAVRRQTLETGAWKLSELVEKYVTEHVGTTKMTKRGPRQPSEKSIADARRYLNDPSLADLQNTYLPDMRQADVEKARDTARKRSKSAGRKVVQYASSALGWAKRNHAGASGLADVAPWWLGVTTLHVEKVRDRRLSVPEIAKVLFIAEKHRVVPGRRQEQRTSETVVAAMWWVVLTAQRTGASMLLRRANIIPDPDARDSFIAAWPAENMKSRRFHALPLSPRVHDTTVGRAARERNRETQWAFPSGKIRRRGTGPDGEVVDLHVSDAALSLLIRRLRGRDPLGIERGAPDLLEGVPEFSPHDLRRSLTTRLSDLKVRGDAASAILDHSSATPGGVEFQQAAITALAYDHSQKIDLKREALDLWSAEIFAAFDALWLPWLEERQRKSLIKFADDMRARGIVSKPGPFDPDGPDESVGIPAADRGPTDAEWEEIEQAEEAERITARMLDLAQRRNKIDLGRLKNMNQDPDSA